MPRAVAPNPGTCSRVMGVRARPGGRASAALAQPPSRTAGASGTRARLGPGDRMSGTLAGAAEPTGPPQGLRPGAAFAHPETLCLHPGGK
jgi:protein involved in polysaccharide export with SLBB domain